jgi:aminopeptidase N
MDYLIKEGLLTGKNTEETFAETINGYIEFYKSGLAEPITQHADHYETNTAYSVSAYTKGALALLQLEYIIGEATFKKALLHYYDTWKFKHPHPQDFFRVMEKESNMVLDWYQNYWVNTTEYTDYAIDTIVGDNVYLARIGAMPMPLEIEVEMIDGHKELYYIPLTLMRGVKSFTKKDSSKINTMKSWDWANPYYPLNLPMSKVKSIHIVPSNYIIDMNIENNKWSKE